MFSNRSENLCAIVAATPQKEADRLVMEHKAGPSMKPGRVKGNSGCDRFTLLFEFPQLASKWLKFVVSFNGATSSHSRPRVLFSGPARVSRHLNQFPNLPCPT